MRLADGTDNTVRGNAIFSNWRLGIGLGNSGFAVTPNDAGDADTGPNDLQNFPVINTVTDGANTRLTGTLNSVPESVFDLDFYANDSADPTGYGQGQYYLGSTTVITNGDGDADADFDVTLPVASSSGQAFSATATAADGSTSEFSRVLRIFTVNSALDLTDATPLGDGVVDVDLGTPGNQVTLRATIQEATALAVDVNVQVPGGTYTLDIAGAGEQAVASGDLDVTDTAGHLTITGAGPDTTIIDADGLDRVFEVLSGATLNIFGITVTGGAVAGGADGGGIRNLGVLTLVNSTIRQNDA